MLTLHASALTGERAAWEQAGVALPQFDYAEMRAHSKANPVWVHFGAGNIFRGFIAKLQQKLLNQSLSRSGIVAADTFDYDIIEKIYRPHDDLSLLVNLCADGSTEKEMIASISESLKADCTDEDWARLTEIFRSPALQMVSFTITEKGYGLTDMSGALLPVVRADMEAGPSAAKHAMSIVAALLLARYQAGAHPVSLVSMDNCSHNGEKLASAVLEIAKAWNAKAFVDAGFVSYLQDESKVAFPWSMIDKITPRPSEVVQAQLEQAGVADIAPIVTARNTFIAPFVNAEVPEYLVVEDAFPNGRPPLEQAGVYFTTRDTVNNTERMKVTTCLNPLHTALAVYGCLLGYTSIAQEMTDPLLKTLVEKIGYAEGLPVVVHPGIIDPMAFIREVIEQRLPNPFIPDAPQRIATDTSQKVGIRFGETIKSYMNSPELDASGLTYIPLALAGWCRYLLAVDDQLAPMTLSSDPMLADLQSALSGVEAGNPASYSGQLKPVLANAALFGVNLYEAGLGEKIETMFVEMLGGKGAIRATLEKYLA